MGLLPIDDDENAMRSATLPSRDREGAVASVVRATTPQRSRLGRLAVYTGRVYTGRKELTRPVFSYRSKAPKAAAKAHK